MRKIIALLLAVLLMLGVVGCGDTEAAMPELKISAYVYDESIDRYLLDVLEVGKVYRLAVIGYQNMININLLLEFDGGICRAVSPNGDMQLSIASEPGPWIDMEDARERMYGFDIKVSSGRYLAVRPLGTRAGAVDPVRQRDAIPFRGYVGCEYDLIVYAYELADEKSPLITANLRLTQLEDSTNGEECSRNFSIELVSYEMGETYAMELAS